jgi:hypothetical protein
MQFRRKPKDETIGVDGKSGKPHHTAANRDALRRVVLVVVGLAAIVYTAYTVGTWNGRVVVVSPPTDVSTGMAGP